MFKRPIKISFIVVLISVLVAANAYSISGRVIPSCATILTFSSGIIVLFCYCSIITIYEETPKKVRPIAPIAVIGVALAISTITGDSKNTAIRSKIIIHSEKARLMLIAVGVLVITMICINKALFSPNKPIIIRY